MINAPSRETDWGLQHAIDLLQPLNTNTVNQDTFDFQTGGPSLLNNGLNRDGGITELYENSASINGADFTYVTSNGLALGLKTDGTILSTTQNSSMTNNVYPSTTLYPSLSTFPGGGYGSTVQIGKLNAFNFFNKVSVPTYYLDCVVSSSSSVAGYSYTLIAARYGSTSTIIIEELDPETMQVLAIANVLQSYIANVTTLTVLPSISLARMNIMTFGDASTTTWGTVITDGGFIYNVGTAVHYWRDTVTRDTAKTTDLNYQSFTCYNNGGTTIFTTADAGTTGAYYNATPGTYTAGTWSGRAQYASTDATMLGDSGTNVLAAAATTLTLGAMSNPAQATSARYPVFVITVSAIGAVATSTGWNVFYKDAEANDTKFRLEYGVVTCYGACGIYSNGGATPLTAPFGNFHLTTFVANAEATAPTGLGLLAYPQLDVKHQMVRVRSFKGAISLLVGDTSSFTDTNDAGNIINDFAGGSFEYDLMSGSPANNGLSSAARNYYFHPLSWRGASATTGVTVYRLNNGDFVAISSSSTPKFSEISTGVVTLNLLSAWGAIIDVNTEIVYYNYSGYTPSFRMDRNNATASDILYTKIFNKYSSSLDQGQVGALYTRCQPMSSTSMIGWTVWNGQTGVNIGDFVTSTTAPNPVAPYAPHLGIYVFNANVPPGGDAVYLGGGIQMLNATAIQTPLYYGYYLFPGGGGSNLLPWRDADVFLLHGTYYAYNNEYIYQVNLTNGSSGVIQGAPIAIAYAIGLVYLCVSPNKAYFVSDYDNSIYYFDGGRSLIKFFEANQKPDFVAGAYNVRDNALYLLTASSIITLRDEQTQGALAGQVAGVNSEGLQITENSLPSSWVSASSFMKSTANGLFFVSGNTVAIRSYFANGTIIPMDYRTAHYSPAAWQTMQIGRIAGQIYWASNMTGSVTLTLYFIRVDGTTDSSTATVTSSTRNAEGYSRFSWNPPTSNVTAASVRVHHDGTEQKIVLMEFVMYYKAGPEVIPLTEVAV